MSAWQHGAREGVASWNRSDNWGHSPTIPEQIGAQEVTAAAAGPVWGALLERGHQEGSLPVTCFPVSTELVVLRHSGSYGLVGGRQGPHQTQGKGPRGPAALAC